MWVFYYLVTVISLTKKTPNLPELRSEEVARFSLQSCHRPRPAPLVFLPGQPSGTWQASVCQWLVWVFKDWYLGLGFIQFPLVPPLSSPLPTFLSAISLLFQLTIVEMGWRKKTQISLSFCCLGCFWEEDLVWSEVEMLGNRF